MNRLQKKCFVATVGLHLLLLVLLVVGPAFFAPREKPDDLPVLDVIPARLIDAQVISGVRNARPPAPTTPPAPQPVVTPPPPAPRREVQPPRPPEPKRVEKPEPVPEVVKTPAPEPRRVEKRVRPEHKIEINTKLTTRVEVIHSTSAQSRNNLRQQEQHQEQLRQQAFQSAIQNLRHSFSPSTTVDMPGNSSVAYANYAAVVKSVYERAWIPPDNAQNDEANVKVTVTIARDGTVVSARIIGPSDDPGVDASVQRTLERVKFIAPFPEGSTEKERTYTINFNLKAKRMLG
ncbi:MAG: TonB family protein [Verrucomicrobiota bacterium]|nr:TonB family protein [Verrucomicrobiota bacterium]